MTQATQPDGHARFRAVTLRAAEVSDEPLLREMLYLAVFVPEGEAPPAPSIVEGPELARYVSGWGRSGDEGVIALAPDGDPIGAAWIRLWSEHDRGYGFVDVDTPEMSVAVRTEYRGHGIGTRLIRHLLERADETYASVSLSVSAQNPAVRLDERLGFATVAINGASITMRRSRRHRAV